MPGHADPTGSTRQHDELDHTRFGNSSAGKDLDHEGENRDDPSVRGAHGTKMVAPLFS